MINMTKYSKNQLVVWAKWIDYALIVVLSSFCLKYITYFGRSFAEQFVQFPCLGFPIFVGEFLLAFCLMLVGIRLTLSPKLFKFWDWIIIVFYGFVCVKAAVGFVRFGPLALRDAALFYYTLFACVGYLSYRREIFKDWTGLLFYLALFWLVFDSQYNEFWLVPRIFIGLALALFAPHRVLSVLMILGVLMPTPYEFFLNASRSVFLGGFISIAFLLITIVFVLNSKQRKIFLVCNSLIILSLGLYIFYFSGSKPAQGLLAVDKLNTFFQEMSREIERKKEGYVPEQLNDLKVFYPNEKSKAVEASTSEDPTEEQGLLNEPQVAMKEETVSSGITNQAKEQDNEKSIKEMKIGNSVFRLLLWQDAIKEMRQEKRLFGIDFGKPFRSQNLEIIRSGVGEWERDGWIAMHNSYLNILYRAGLVGVFYIAVVVMGFVYMTRTFIIHKSIAGLLVCSSLLVPFVAAFFAVTLEVPYFAIPIWTLYGFLLRWAHDKNVNSDISHRSANI